ncbi:TonB-dependent receptor [Flavitalea sp. BT771]|uniref:SusC/RagA family TonB-linked outer membrane protein n=1 Tax=Flavitalea sp. BT771 TaxID=3063329 RepID=UPI0026E3B7FD|nr:TonB-dependent receptor [Flavitalea sp. BT771]MDO6429299.1 TonB-dependent receptor [Flavitalea sp. BT771]MDV6218573.1 TonB-dependent receptor [Flavitalea sp. BT771]
MHVKAMKVSLVTMLYGILFLFAGSARAQGSRTISGNIRDEKGLPLAGASISIKGTQRGTTSDSSGNFSLSLPENTGTLIIAFVGYETRELNAANGVSLSIQLTPDKNARQLEDMVVVGYGTQRKVNLTGSVASITSKDLDYRPVTNLTNALQGSMAGVTITTTGGQPGADVGAINIRGIGTLNNSAPMVVIDGIIGDLRDVNPNDVASISVLKDAASAAIYGSRAANGVLLVTTKRGRNGRMQISYDAYVGKQKATALPDFLPSWQAATLYNQARANEGQTPYWTDNDITLFRNGSDPDTHPNTDWQGLLYKGNGIQQNHYVSVTGGDPKTQYALSLGYFNQDGIIKKSAFKRYSSRLNITSALSKSLSVNANLSFLYSNQQAPDGLGGGDIGGIIGTTSAMSSTVVNQYKNGVYNYLSFGNPIAWLNSPGYNNQQNYTFLGNMGADWELLKGLHLRPSFSYRYNGNPLQEFKSADTYYSPTDPTVIATTISPSSLSNTNITNNYTNLQALLEYDKRIQQHSFNILAGASQELTKYNYLYAYRQGFLNNSLSELNAASTLGQQTAGTANAVALRSVFGRVRYAFEDKYLLEANLRYDGSSRFGDGHKWGTYPSFSAGWNISKEAFFQPLMGSITALKLRGSWGKLGNQNIGSPYPSVSVVSSGQNYSFNQTVAPGIAPTSGANANITWERTTLTDVGLDLALLGNRLNFTADHYVKNTDGILLQLPSSVVYGFSTPFRNAGAVKNSGWEFAAAYTDKAGAFTYNVAANAAFNKNRITDLAGTGSMSTGYVAGRPIKAFYGYVVEGIFQTQQQVTDHATQSGGTIAPGDLMYKDLSGPAGKPDGVIDGKDRTYIGSPFPGMTYGLTLGGGWKGFALSAFFQGAFDVKNYVQGFALGSLQQPNIGNPTSALLGAWTAGHPTSFPRLWTTFTQNNPQNNVSSFWVRNASYLRMKNITVSYTLPAGSLVKWGIQNLKIYYSGQNLFTSTSFYKWVDPETTIGNNAYGAYPQVKVNTIGINVIF